MTTTLEFEPAHLPDVHKGQNGIAVGVALIRRTLAERRRLIAGLTFAAAAIAAMTASLYSSLGAEYEELLDDLPAAVMSMLGDADLGTPEGWLQVELFSLVGPGLALGAGIAVGAGVVAGAEQSGRLTLITSGPTTRSTVIWSALATTVIAVFIVASGFFVGILGGSVVGDLGIAASKVAAACLSLALLGVAVGAITLAVGAATGNRGAAVAAGTTIGIGSYMVDAFFPLSSTLEPFSKVSLWYPFSANQPIVNGLHWGHASILVMIVVAASVVARWGFERRDLHP